MAIINSTLNKANPGTPADDLTPDIDLTYKVFNDTDGYTTPEVFGSSVNDADVNVSNGIVTIQNVAQPSGVGAYRISSIDGEGLESPLSVAYPVSVPTGGNYIQMYSDFQGMAFNNNYTTLTTLDVVFAWQIAYGAGVKYNYLLLGVAYQNNIALTDDGLFWGGYAVPTSWSINGEAGVVDNPLSPATNTYFGGKKLSDYVASGLDITVSITFGTNDNNLSVNSFGSTGLATSSLGGILKSLKINNEQFLMSEGIGNTTTGSEGTIATFSATGTNWVKDSLTTLFEDDFRGSSLDAKWNGSPSSNCAIEVDNYLALLPSGVSDEAPYSCSVVSATPITKGQLTVIRFDIFMANEDNMPDVFVGLSKSANAQITTDRWGIVQKDAASQFGMLFQWTGYSSQNIERPLNLQQTRSMRVIYGGNDLNKIWAQYWSGSSWVDIGSPDILQGTSTNEGDLVYPMIAGGDEIGKASNLVVSNFAVTDYNYATKEPYLDGQLFADDFNFTAINSNKWTDNQIAGVSIVESGGDLTMLQSGLTDGALYDSYLIAKWKILLSKHLVITFDIESANNGTTPNYMFGLIGTLVATDLDDRAGIINTTTSDQQAMLISTGGSLRYEASPSTPINPVTTLKAVIDEVNSVMFLYQWNGSAWIQRATSVMTNTFVGQQWYPIIGCSDKTGVTPTAVSLSNFKILNKDFPNQRP